MSRIGKLPVPIPKGVDVTIAADSVSIKGPLGSLARTLTSHVKVKREGDELLVETTNDSTQANAMSGTIRALMANMIQGVTKGYERKLNLVGVGYRAQAAGDAVNLTLGFSHPVSHKIPKGIKVATPTQTEIVVTGIDKQMVGQVAAEIRAYRSPEPYKGKGVRYANEVVVIKETKKK
ncbi:MAG: 50S ribosomal protein L6 [Burkholderiales bacterium]